MKLKLLKDGNNPMNTNSYLIYDEESKNAWIIDASSDSKLFIDTIDKLGLKLNCLLLTHGHWDHIIAADFWRKNYKAKIVAHEKCKDYLTNPMLNLSGLYSDIDELNLDADIYLKGDHGKFEIFEYYHTPGHSYDHLIYKLGNELVFSGDLVFQHSVGRTDLPGSTPKDLINSIRNIFYKNCDDQAIILPGHGNNSLVKEEKENNPYVPLEE
ncbi:MBL fold metallo-hydrolase [uncultured Helcococcus sp.]|uniref:MBL fold metallo-hydrolase n=1 Tax=uncultured Helcococcus sp. TaxID=1072508 RepID=UPI00288A51A5|nr:MBL fold metallo-hydrolase [uncultured Helcococcus sp.]